MLAPSTPPTHLTLAEVALVVRVCPKTLENWLHTGKFLCGFKVGKR
jgi:hypothetical protein